MDSRRVPPPPPVFLPGLAGPSVRRGVWSAEEHDRFLQALKRFPDGPWRQLALCVGTRSTRQVQTHAQKFFEKIRRRQRGLRRSYVHTGMAREHRVDNDVVAILSSMPTSDQDDDDDNTKEEEHEDEDADDDGEEDDEDVDSEQDAHGSDQEEDQGGATASSSSKRPKSAGKRKRSTSSTTQDSKPTTINATAEEPPPTLPRRIRIRRSARNALQIAANRDQLYAEVMGFATAAAALHEELDAATLLIPKSEPVEPVEPTRTDLPSIEEALDFFLHSIDGDNGHTNAQRSTIL